MEYLLGIDIGTSGVKGILLSVDGKIITTGIEGYPLYTPHAGWAEQNPEDWWEAAVKCIRGIMEKSGVAPGAVQGLSFSGQMHSSVFLDEEMEVIRPAILWSDTRTSNQCQEIYQSVGGLGNLISHVSNPALEGFTAPKILWLRENEPEYYQKVNMVLLPKDYIRYKLTGEVSTEVSDGAGTLLMDIVEKNWSSKMLQKLEIDREILPEIVESITITGRISPEVASITGLAAGTPVVAGGADNACGAVGSGIIKAGRVMVSIGSSGVVLAQAGSPTADEKGRIHLFNHAMPGSWYMMGVMLSAGLSFNWLKESLFDDQLDYEHLNKLAAGIEPGSEGLLFLPYLYGERTPHADASARGVFFGISGKHTRGHFIRSVMEGVTFGLRDSLELIKEKGIEINEVRSIGGGARSAVWQQIMADIFGSSLHILNVEEGPAFGAALIAGVGTGAYQSFAEAEERMIKVVKEIEPRIENIDRYNRLYEIYRGLYPSLKSNFKELALNVQGPL